MPPSTGTVMHFDRQLWQSDLARWQQDLAHWLQETAAASADLARAVAALQEHRQALESFGEWLRGEEEFLSEYEAAVGGSEPVGPSLEGPGPTDALTERLTGHPRLWDAHERLKRHHHAIVATLALLLRALDEPM